MKPTQERSTPERSPWTVRRCHFRSRTRLAWPCRRVLRAVTPKHLMIVCAQDDAEGLYCQEQINRSIYWADGYVLVFSITDHSSYRTIQPLYQHVRRIHPSGNIPVILIGNKSDLLRARQVPADEGETLASSLGGAYFEASARENHEGVHTAFLQLCHEVSRALGGGNGEKRRGGLHLARPKSPNMQELKRRFRQVLSSKVKSASAL
ncbi:ras-like protein family member 11A-like isoform X2 [Syngnathus scovelli]|uniref:ras-like protein family member 11A-like isoform X2 n=1 Tax=Syngnathus scovelli TaxID=161590 RepID=UPI0021106FF0|nr:ras-like protein family member 11A-like isoform X2 [Syngnathus scovelli]